MNIIESYLYRIIARSAYKKMIKERAMSSETYSKTINVFIAQKMHGLKESEVMLTRIEAKNKILKYFDKKDPDVHVKFIDNYYHDGIEVPEGAGRLWHLGISITQLDKADYIYFTKDAFESNGGNIEYEIAKRYKIPILRF